MLRNKLREFRNFMLAFSILPETIYHVLRAESQEVEYLENCWSNYAKWVINITTQEK